MVSIRRIAEADYSNLIELRVTADQEKYVGTVQELLDNLLEDKQSHLHPHVILAGEQIVGFFNIDINYSDTYKFTHNRELGLRAFLIGSEYQGKGYAKLATAALKQYLMNEYPNFTSITLTVNCQNPNAYKAYLKGGFVDAEELYHGGEAGPQHIMRMELRK